MIIWITGLSGAGKTTIGRRLYEKIKAGWTNTVFLDGDVLRELMGHDLGYSLEDREKNAWRICRLCRWLDAQEIHVVCCVLSVISGVHHWNRMNYKQYFEIYIDVSWENLIQRDTKNLYQPALEGRLANVVGVDIDYQPPPRSDYVIDNNIFVDPDETAEKILNHLPVFQ